MEVLFSILLNIIFPVFLLMSMGVFFHRLYRLDLRTLSKITTFYLLPVVGFVNVYQSEINGSVVIEVIGFQLLLVIVLIILGEIISKLLRLDKGIAANLKNSIVLVNSGNYGLPVSQLVFVNNPLGMTIQIVVMTIQNFVTYTYGLFNSVSANHQGSKVLYEFLKMPMLYALLLAMTFQIFHIKVPLFLWEPITSISNAFLAIALFSLGAQVAFFNLKRFDMSLIFSCLGRLIFAPLIALGLIFLLGLTGTTAKALFIASSFPASRNSAQLALEYNNHPDFAGQIVLISTLLSSITVTMVVYIAGILF